MKKLNIFRAAVSKFTESLSPTKALVLNYHRVFNSSIDPQMLCVSIRLFDKQMKLLSEEYNVIKPKDMNSILKGGLFRETKKIPVLLTFDDGYYDNYSNAVPILEKYGFQAIFFVTYSNVVNKSLFWWDLIEPLIQGRVDSPSFNYLLGNLSLNLDLSNNKSRNEAYKYLISYLKELGPKERNDLVCELKKFLKYGKKFEDNHRILSSEDLKKLANSSSAAVGAHTVDHVSFSKISSMEKVRQLSSKESIEKIIGKKVNYFSYPYGGRFDIDKDSINLVGKKGFDFACANYFGHVGVFSNKYSLPRVVVRDWNEKDFKNKIKEGVFY